MQAVVHDDYGPPGVLYLAELPDALPGPGQIGIRVAAAAINPADVKWRSGMLRHFGELQFPQVLGYDVAGTVSSLGTGVTGFAVGDRVVGMLDHRLKGAYAEYAAIAPDCCVQLPASMDFALGSAIPTPGLTGVQLITGHVRPQPGQRVLITGACGSVGRFAVYAALRAGAQVIAAVRASQRAQAVALGATQAIVLGEPYAGDAFDHVADTVGGPAVAALCRHLNPGARIRTVATTPIDPAGLATTPEFIALHADAALLAHLVAAVATGEIDYRVARRLPPAQAAEAHRLMEAGGLDGKVVLDFTSLV